jgi:purine-nucleoside phosphorylase
MKNGTTDGYVSEVNEAVKAIRGRSSLRPKVGLVLGTGLGGLADKVEDATTISYKDIPGFPIPGVKGHAGVMTLGHLGGLPVVCLKGRVHLYEGGGYAPLKIMIRTLKALGIEFLFLTNAAGSLRTDIGPGELVAMKDHINFMGTNPLVGPNDDAFGERFVDLEHCWDPELRAQLSTAASEKGVQLHEGVFAGWMGPAFETPAEIRMLQILKCDTVGMSMVPDNIVARHCGLKCVGVSAITNYACSVSDAPVTHSENVAVGEVAGEKLAPVIVHFLSKFV